VVRTAVPLASILATVSQARWHWAASLLAGLLVAGAAALLLARRLLRRLQRLVGFAGKLAAGEAPPYPAPGRPGGARDPRAAVPRPGTAGRRRSPRSPARGDGPPDRRHDRRAPRRA